MADGDGGIVEAAGGELVGVVVWFMKLGAIEDTTDRAGCALECGKCGVDKIYSIRSLVNVESEDIGEYVNGGCRAGDQGKYLMRVISC